MNPHRNLPDLLRFADLTIESAVPLPSLPAALPTRELKLRITAPRTVVDLHPCEGWLHEWQDPHGNTCLQFTQSVDSAPGDASTCRLRVPRLCDFHVHQGSGCTTISIEHMPGVDAETLEHLLIDQILPRVIAEQGALVVHASCVSIGSSCALFLGESGWGKSTLGGLLQRHGYTLQSDDCTVLTMHGCQAHAVPTYPSLRLFGDSIHHAFATPPELSPLAAYTGKHRVHVAVASDGTATPVTAIYLLNDPLQQSRNTTIQPVPAASACMSLVEHGFRLDMNSHQRSATFLQQAAAIANSVPAHALRYPRDFTQSDRMIAMLLQHFQSLQLVSRTPLSQS